MHSKGLFSLFERVCLWVAFFRSRLQKSLLANLLVFMALCVRMSYGVFIIMKNIYFHRNPVFASGEWPMPIMVPFGCLLVLCHSLFPSLHTVFICGVAERHNA